MDIREILNFLPHRDTYLMMDKVNECEHNNLLDALKNVTYNEQFFQGHFPGHPIMPAVLILEAMAQATGLLAIRSIDEASGDDSMFYFVGIDKARFRKPVGPGDQLIVEVIHEKTARNIWRVAAVAKVGEDVVAEATIMGALRDIES